MSKDYKHRRRSPSRGKAPAQWRWFASGLAVGIALSGLALVSLRGSELLSTRPGIPKLELQPSGALQESRPSEEAKPRFEFYTMLPEMEVAVPDSEIRSSTSDGAQEAAPARGTYLLQVGSFRKLGEADGLKASLALLGLEAHIQTVSINGEQTWHRVRLGPFSKTSQLNEARTRLQENQIEAMVLKLRS